MKILKYLFFLLLLVFVGGAIYFATKEGNYQVESTTVINAPVPVVFKKVEELKTWGEWGPWKTQDSTVVLNFPQKTRGEGGSFSWNGKDWDGSIKTTNVIPDNSINQNMSTKTTTVSRKADMYWRFEQVAQGTEVTWGIKGEHSLKDKAILALTQKDFRGTMQQFLTTGLNALDAGVQKDLQVYTISLDGVTQYGGGFYMYASTATNLDAQRAKMEQLIPKVKRYMTDNNISISGDPMTIYNQYDVNNNAAIISCAIPTTTRVIVPDDNDVLCSFMPAQTVVKTTLKGDYKNLSEAWTKAMAYLTENNYKQAEDSLPFEIYIKGPDEEPNPAEWLTELYIPIETQSLEGPEKNDVSATL